VLPRRPPERDAALQPPASCAASARRPCGRGSGAARAARSAPCAVPRPSDDESTNRRTKRERGLRRRPCRGGGGRATAGASSSYRARALARPHGRRPLAGRGALRRLPRRGPLRGAAVRPRGDVRPLRPRGAGQVQLGVLLPDVRGVSNREGTRNRRACVERRRRRRGDRVGGGERNRRTECWGGGAQGLVRPGLCHCVFYIGNTSHHARPRLFVPTFHFRAHARPTTTRLLDSATLGESKNVT